MAEGGGIRDGWGNPHPFNPTTKFHYFIEKKSLCGKYADSLGKIKFIERRDDYKSNCIRCKEMKLWLDATNII